MYYEIFHENENARNREKQIKKYRREKKVALFANSNAHWEDLSTDFAKSIKEILM